MLQAVYIFLGTVALLTSAVSVSNRLPVDVNVAGAAAAFVLWTMWGFASYDIEVVTDSGTVVTREYIPLAIVGLAAAAVMLAYAAYLVMTMFGMDPQRLLKVRV